MVKSTRGSYRKLRFSFHHPHVGSSSVCSFSSGELDTLFQPPQAPNTHRVHTRIDRQNAHKYKSLKKRERAEEVGDVVRKMLQVDTVL